MNSAKSRIGAGDIEAGGHARLCSCSGEQRLTNARRHEYGVAWAKLEKRGAVRRELVKQHIFVTALAANSAAGRSPAAGRNRRGVGKARQVRSISGNAIAYFERWNWVTPISPKEDPEYRDQVECLGFW